MDSRPPIALVPPSAPLLADDEDAWRDNLIVGSTKDGAVRVAPVPANVATFLRFHPDWRGVIAYDAFAEAVIVTRTPPWHLTDMPQDAAPGPWTESDTARAVNWLMRDALLKVPPKAVDDSLLVVGEANRVHPVRAYLEGLSWDAKQRLPSFLPTYFGTQDDDYARGIGMRWLISAIARIMRPGCQVDCTLLIEGTQGLGKTSAFRALVPVPSWYADTGITIGDKDSYQNLHGVWLYGLDEIDSLKRGELTKVKNFLTATQDRYRPSYGRRAVTFPRQCIFGGTTNEDEYLSDRTGNRRFWPVKARRIDVQAIARDRDQLWAEAFARYTSGEPWHVDTPELRKLCAVEQTARIQQDPWAEIVSRWLELPTVPGADGTPDRLDPSNLTTADVLLGALKFRPADIGKADHMRAGDVLRDLGYVRGPRIQAGGSRTRRYVLRSTLAAE